MDGNYDTLENAQRKNLEREMRILRAALTNLANAVESELDKDYISKRLATTVEQAREVLK